MNATFQTESFSTPKQIGATTLWRRGDERRGDTAAWRVGPKTVGAEGSKRNKTVHRRRAMCHLVRQPEHGHIGQLGLLRVEEHQSLLRLIASRHR